MLVPMCQEMSCLLRLFPMAAWRKAGRSLDQRLTGILPAQFGRNGSSNSSTAAINSLSMQTCATLGLQSSGIGVSVFGEMGMHRPCAFLCFLLCLLFVQ